MTTNSSISEATVLDIAMVESTTMATSPSTATITSAATAYTLGSSATLASSTATTATTLADDQKVEHDAGHQHFSHRSPWLRAGVLGANDGLVSVASVMLGVTAGVQGPEGRSLMVLSGLASLVAGALSMALGEYVSVYSQRDAEEADILRERSEFLKSPEAWKQEEKELALIYQQRGLSARLAAEVARELHSKHLDEVVKIHARDELGIDTDDLSDPMQAALLSAVTFALGAGIPMLAGSFVDDYLARILWITIISSVGLFVFGAVGAVVGGAPFLKAALRVLIGGWIAMAGTFGIGKLFGATVG